MIIDLFTHLAPKTFLDRMVALSPSAGNIVRRLLQVRPLFDLDARFREMDVVSDYRQVISLPNPPLEDMATPQTGQDLARIANDELAELCGRFPDRFRGFVAAASLLDPDGAVREVERAFHELGAVGVQVYTSVAGQPLDHPQFQSFFGAMASLGRPIWLHPTRSSAMTDYVGEEKSRYEMWWCFGWPYDTSVAMSRLVFSGLFDRYPNLRILTHHLGGMIPYYDGRIGPGMEVLGARTSDEDYSKIIPSLKRPHMDYFHMFFADTAMFGGSGGLRCGLEFFGPDKVVFATDAPLGPIAKTVQAIGQLELDDETRRKIMYENGERLLRRESAKPQTPARDVGN